MGAGKGLSVRGLLGLGALPPGLGLAGRARSGVKISASAPRQEEPADPGVATLARGWGCRGGLPRGTPSPALCSPRRGRSPGAGAAHMEGSSPARPGAARPGPAATGNLPCQSPAPRPRGRTRVSFLPAAPGLPPFPAGARGEAERPPSGPRPPRPPPPHVTLSGSRRPPQGLMGRVVRPPGPPAAGAPPPGGCEPCPRRGTGAASLSPRRAAAETGGPGRPLPRTVLRTANYGSRRAPRRLRRGSCGPLAPHWSSRDVASRTHVGTGQGDWLALRRRQPMVGAPRAVAGRKAG